MDSRAHAANLVGWPLRIFALAFAALSVGVARADCKAVIAAYSAADATRRFAMYDVDSITAAPKGEPRRVVLGDTEYNENDIRKGAFDIVKDGYKKGGVAYGFEANSVRDDEKKGKVRCEPLGERKVGGEVLVGYQVRSNDLGTAPDPSAIHVWVSKASGLPGWTGMGSDGGGFRWVYGAQVTAPPASEIRQ